MANLLVSAGSEATSSERVGMTHMSGTFASPSLQNLTSPLKERIIGQKELANLIEKVKSGIIARVE